MSKKRICVTINVQTERRGQGRREAHDSEVQKRLEIRQEVGGGLGCIGAESSEKASRYFSFQITLQSCQGQTIGHQTERMTELFGAIGTKAARVASDVGQPTCCQEGWSEEKAPQNRIIYHLSCGPRKSWIIAGFLAKRGSRTLEAMRATSHNSRA